MNKLLAPNGKPSNLTPKQYKLVRTPEFKAWFGDWQENAKIQYGGFGYLRGYKTGRNSSLAIDENGEPKVFYHQTSIDNYKGLIKSGIINFELEYGGGKSDKLLPIGFYLKPSSEDIFKEKKDYAQVPFFLNLRSIETFENRKDILEHYERTTRFSKFIKNKKLKLTDKTKITDYFKSIGIDCVRIIKDFDSWEVNFTETLLVLDKNNIKLADGTNTTFDSNNPDIRYEGGGGISNIDQYTSKKIKKAYVSIRIKYESGRAENDKFYNNYEIKSFDEKTFEELKDHKLKGILGVSTSNYNLSEWLVHRECLVVMPFDKFLELNKTEQVQYYDADYLTKNGLDALYRLYDRKDRTDQDYYSILQNLFPKISNEFNLEGMVKKGTDYTNMYVVSDLFNVYNSGNFIRHVAKQERINSPYDLAKIVIDYTNSEQIKNDYPYNRSVENLTIESIINPITKGIVNSGRIYVDESEWLIKNSELVIPENSQLFFVLKGYDNMRSKYDEIISKYDLKSSYKIGFINQKNLNELQSKRFNLKDEKWKAEYQKARTETEKRILKTLQSIQNEIIEKWTNQIIEDFKVSDGYENYKDYDGNQYGNNILEVPDAITYFDSLMLRFIDIYNARIDNIVETKSKYAFVDIKNDFTRYLEDLKDKEGNDELGVKTEWHHIYKEDLLRKLLYGIRVGDYFDLDNIGEKIKLEVGSDLYRYFSKDEISFKKGGRVRLSKTPAPKSERIYGSKINKPKSSASKSKASSIILSPKVITSINTILEKHNEKSNKKIPLATAKAVVRRGMGAYSSTHRPTISGGKPNSRVAWGLARLNAFVYKIQKGYSKSGRYTQDDDLINELGYKVKKYELGGLLIGEYDDENTFPTREEAFEIIENSVNNEGNEFIGEDGMFENEQKAKQYVDEVYDFFDYYYSLEMIPVYRSLSVPLNEVDLDPYLIGESWSLSLDSAKIFGSRAGLGSILSGYVPKNNVDWESAFRLYVKFSDLTNSDSEFELPIPPNNKIYDVTISDYKNAKELEPYNDEKYESGGNIEFDYKLNEVYPNIFLLEMYDQYDLASCFVRCQAFYEWDNFRGKDFKIQDFHNSYAKTYPQLKPYQEEFYGFNLPSEVIRNCYQVNKERTNYDNFFLEVISKIKKDNYYLIGVVEGDTTTLNHELAHAFFWADKSYRDDMTKLVNEIPNKNELLKILNEERGYGENVLMDEAQAFLSTGLIVNISDWEDYRNPFIERFERQYKLNNNSFEDGGEITLTSEQIEQKLGRKLHWWNDDIVSINGIEYKKVFLKNEYKKV